MFYVIVLLFAAICFTTGGPQSYNLVSSSLQLFTRPQNLGQLLGSTLLLALLCELPDACELWALQ